MEESKYYTDIMKKHFNKELVMTRKDNEDFANSTKCWICSHVYVEGDVNPLLTNVPILGTFSFLSKIVLIHLF